MINATLSNTPRLMDAESAGAAPAAAIIKLLSAIKTPLARLYAVLRSFGPYAVIELVLPGGSLVALLLWHYRHRHGPGH